MIASSQGGTVRKAGQAGGCRNPRLQSGRRRLFACQRGRLDRAVAALVGADADGILDGQDEDFAVADLPVLADCTIASTAFCTRSSAITISNFTFGRKSTVYSLHDRFPCGPFCRPEAFHLAHGHPSMPISDNASFTSSILKGLMIASIFFIGAPLC
jgi:hypothetical protein